MHDILNIVHIISGIFAEKYELKATNLQESCVYLVFHIKYKNLLIEEPVEIIKGDE